jgi:anti-sigma regulatory factor (Ser/Thr protein kinase)
MTQAELDKRTLPSSAVLGFEVLDVPATRRSTEAAWSDVFAAGTERFVISVGNTTGGQAELSVLIAAIRDAFDPKSGVPGPRMLLLAADAVARWRNTAGTPSASAVVGIVDCLEHTLTYVSAGHPPPFVRYHDGTVATLPVVPLPSKPTRCEHPPAQVVVDLRGAALVLLYSSARVKASADDVDGVERLGHVLADERMSHCSSPAAWIARQVLGSVSHDEAALLALTLVPTADPSPPAQGERPHWTAAWSFDSRSAASNGARRAFLACLRSKATGGAAIDFSAAELIFGELLGNVVRHAPGPVDIILDWTDVLPVLHVLDRGPGFRSRRKRERLPVDELSESGRGLFIVNACAPHFSVRNRNGRGTHASATLPLA